MCELAAVAVGDRGEQPAAVVAGVQLNLGNAGKLLTDHVGVLAGVAAELVKIDLLVEIGVLRRALVALRIARVVEARTVGLPRDAAAAGGEVDARHDIGKLLAGSDIEDVGGGIFRSVSGERGGDIFSAE